MAEAPTTEASANKILSNIDGQEPHPKMGRFQLPRSRVSVGLQSLNTLETTKNHWIHRYVDGCAQTLETGVGNREATGIGTLTDHPTKKGLAWNMLEHKSWSCPILESVIHSHNFVDSIHCIS